MSEPDTKPLGADPTRRVLTPNEVELGAVLDRLKQWEIALETTNPAQAKAELLAVQEKRFTLQKERSHATDIIIDLRRALAGAEKEIDRLKAELDEARKAPERSEEQ